MGKSGVERVRRFFSLDICVEEHIRAYNAVLGRAYQFSNAETTLVADTGAMGQEYSRD
jgi:hypothetical protein